MYDAGSEEFSVRLWQERVNQGSVVQADVLEISDPLPGVTAAAGRAVVFSSSIR